VVTLVGFKLAEQKPDCEHPFGHGRIEYLAGLLVSAAILIMAFELMRDAVGKILHPQQTECSVLIIAILVTSILVKCYMVYYNRRIGSVTILAVATDSLSDCITTTVVLAATLINHYCEVNIDGYCGVLVGIFIFYAGLSAAKDTLNPLLGQPPEPEFVKKIEDIVLNFDENISGIHDLIVHDYGPGRRFISLHAEVPAEGEILKLHDIIDNLEMLLKKELGCEATIHMDPVVTKDEHIRELKECVIAVVREMDDALTIHDFRVVAGETHTNLIFDIIIPYHYSRTDAQIVNQIQTRIRETLGEEYFAVIHIDNVAVL
jgi:cation diffusion facilitator family transporter